MTRDIIVEEKNDLSDGSNLKTGNYEDVKIGRIDWLVITEFSFVSQYGYEGWNGNQTHDQDQN